MYEAHFKMAFLNDDAAAAYSGVLEPATSHSVGIDLRVINWHEEKGMLIVGTGVIIEPVNDDCYMHIYARSSLPKLGYMIPNSVGIIDPDYRGELMVPLMRVTALPHPLECGTRIAQMVAVPRIRILPHLVHRDELTKTDRGHNGFGSTGR